MFSTVVGGEGGIRTHGTLTGTPDFESGTIDRAPPPLRPSTSYQPWARLPRLQDWIVAILGGAAAAPGFATGAFEPFLATLGVMTRPGGGYDFGGN